MCCGAVVEAHGPGRLKTQLIRMGRVECVRSVGGASVRRIRKAAHRAAATLGLPPARKTPICDDLDVLGFETAWAVRPYLLFLKRGTWNLERAG